MESALSTRYFVPASSVAWIAPGKTDQHIERHCYQLERDKDENEVDRRNEVHQAGTSEKRQRDKFAQTCLQRGAGKEAAHDRRVIDHHDHHENGGHQRELLEEDRQPIRCVKTPETGRIRRRGKRNDKESGEKNYREPGNCSESQNAFINFSGERFDHQDQHPEHQYRNLK